MFVLRHDVGAHHMEQVFHQHVRLPHGRHLFYDFFRRNDHWAQTQRKILISSDRIPVLFIRVVSFPMMRGRDRLGQSIYVSLLLVVDICYSVSFYHHLVSFLISPKQHFVSLCIYQCEPVPTKGKTEFSSGGEERTTLPGEVPSLQRHDITKQN